MAIEAVLETGLWKGVELLDPEKGRVSRDLFVDEELYAIEKERVSTRAWLFVGFEDQVRKPGDYFVSRMGEESVILSRDRDNTVHVFLNSCRHRGMKVCRYDEGNTPVFTCPYHGWSYAGDGSLVGVPRYKDAYREELDKSQWGLVEVAQMENYKGTVWATWDPSAPSFYEYIGDLESLLGQAIAKPDGSEADIEVVRGVQKWILPSNWKFGHENFLTDGYHGIPTQRSVDLLTLSPSGRQGRHTHDHVTRESYWFTISHHGSGRLTFRVNKENLPYTPTYPKAPAVEAYFGMPMSAVRSSSERWRAFPPPRSPVERVFSPTPPWAIALRCGIPTVRTRPRCGAGTPSTGTRRRRPRTSRDTTTSATRVRQG